MLNNFPKLEKAVINDINEDLINTYKTIASNQRINFNFEILQNEFHNLKETKKTKNSITTKKENCTIQEKKNKADKPLCLFF
jgi:DNA adenine methylase